MGDSMVVAGLNFPKFGVGDFAECTAECLARFSREMQNLMAAHPDVARRRLFLRANIDYAKYTSLRASLEAEGKVIPAIPRHSEPYPDGISMDISAGAESDEVDGRIAFYEGFWQQVVDGCAADAPSTSMKRLKELIFTPTGPNGTATIQDAQRHSGEVYSLFDVAGEHAFADHTDAALAKVVAQGVVTGMVGREATVQEKLNEGKPAEDTWQLVLQRFVRDVSQRADSEAANLAFGPRQEGQQGGRRGQGRDNQGGFPDRGRGWGPDRRDLSPRGRGWSKDRQWQGRPGTGWEEQEWNQGQPGWHETSGWDQRGQRGWPQDNSGWDADQSRWRQGPRGPRGGCDICGGEHRWRQCPNREYGRFSEGGEKGKDKGKGEEAQSKAGGKDNAKGKEGGKDKAFGKGKYGEAKGKGKEGGKSRQW